MPIVKVRCPNCGLLAEYDSDAKTLTCRHCGHRESPWQPWRETAATADSTRSTNRVRQKLLRRSR